MFSCHALKDLASSSAVGGYVNYHGDEIFRMLRLYFLCDCITGDIDITGAIDTEATNIRLRTPLQDNLTGINSKV